MVDEELMREIMHGDSNIATLEQLRPTQIRNLQRAWERMICLEIRKVISEEKPFQEEERLEASILYEQMKQNFLKGFAT